MKVAMLVGGKGSRMGEATVDCPKPMLEVAGRPILWQLMQLCAAQGVSEFVLALGHKGNRIRDYFARCAVGGNELPPEYVEVAFPGETGPARRVHLVDTGIDTMTGGRLKRLKPWLKGEPHFLMTYGDVLADVDLGALERFHAAHGRLVTVVATRVPERFGRLSLDGDMVTKFEEKPGEDRPWINGGVFVLSPAIFDYIDDDTTMWERGPLERLCAAGEVRAFRHEGFWSTLDTPADLSYLRSISRDGYLPWESERAEVQFANQS